jgi:hypothetical protein
MGETDGARVRAVMVLLLLAGVACFRTGRATPNPPRWDAGLAALRFNGDTGTTDTIAWGALHRSFLVRQEPWVIHVLDVDLAACWKPVAVKGAAGAVGRTRTSALVASMLDPINPIAAGVNADFFLFDPPGVPTGAHLSTGAVVTGPGARPVFAIETTGRPWIGALTAAGVAVSGLDSVPIIAWNRLSPDGLAWFDHRYGPAVDTSTGSVRVALDAGGAVQSIDTSGASAIIPSSGGVLVLGNRAPVPVRQRLLLSARSRAQFNVSTRLLPMHPREAVGGFPILVRDSMEVPGLDSAGAPTFAPVRHPRTLVGVASRGRRLLLITIDGRQAGYSVGTTNRESARIALELGATEAINLDGGGSTAMAIARRRGDSVSIEVVNRPSDPQGERAVGNALVVKRDPACERTTSDF